MSQMLIREQTPQGIATELLGEGVSELAPQHTHRFLPTYFFGERVVPLGNKGMKKLKCIARRTVCSQ